MKKPPWPFRVGAWYYRRRYLGYCVLFFISAVWGLASRTGEGILLSALVIPWLFLFLIIINLPFISALVRRFSLSPAERRNHALEHGTISFLLMHRGERRGVGGRAAATGFRISGAKNKAEIEMAFRDFVTTDQLTRSRVAVSNRCGSMLVIAQGVGVISLLLTLVLFGIWPPSPTALALVLGLQALLFVGLCRPLGRITQQKRLLLLDFADARILDIKGVTRDPLFEKGPVFFVRTRLTFPE